LDLRGPTSKGKEGRERKWGMEGRKGVRGEEVEGRGST